MGVSRWGGPRRIPGEYPRPSSPWQPDQFANRRQPRLTYHVFSLSSVYFSPISLPPLVSPPPPPRSFSSTIALQRCSLCPRSPSSLSRFSFFTGFSFAHTHVYTYVRNTRREIDRVKRGEPRKPLAFFLIPVYFLLALSVLTGCMPRDQESGECKRENREQRTENDSRIDFADD